MSNLEQKKHIKVENSGLSMTFDLKSSSFKKQEIEEKFKELTVSNQSKKRAIFSGNHI